MLSYHKKSPATERNRKTRASDKARTTRRKKNKSKSASLNDGSLQLQVQQQPSVSTVTSTVQPAMSASTGQAIRDMFNKLDASNQELSRRKHKFERNGNISSKPLTSSTIPPVSHAQRTAIQQSVFPTQLTRIFLVGLQPLPGKASVGADQQF